MLEKNGPGATSRLFLGEREINLAANFTSCIFCTYSIGFTSGSCHLVNDTWFRCAPSFTPRAYPPEKGFTSVYQSPPRRDYCLFLTIEPSIADLQQDLGERCSVSRIDPNQALRLSDSNRASLNELWTCP